MFLLSSSRTSREMPSSPRLAHKEPVMQTLEGKWSPRLPGGDERVTKRSAWSLVSIFRYWVGRGRRKESMGLICVDPQVNKEPKKKGGKGEICWALPLRNATLDLPAPAPRGVK